MGEDLDILYKRLSLTKQEQEELYVESGKLADAVIR